MWRYLKGPSTGSNPIMARYRPYWQWGGASHPGGRGEQQDRWGVFVLPNRQGLLAVVADGLGGHNDGALGAQAVVDATEQFIHQQMILLCERPAEALSLLCEHSHARIMAVSKLAHSTIVALWLYGKQAHWMHVGDSRLYQLRQGSRVQRTRDHSAAQILVDMGEISEAEIASHPEQNRLYRSLGSVESPRSELGSGLVEANDLFILCSDGLWEHITEDELWETARRSSDLSLAATTLVALAAARGGPQADNSTLVLIRPAKSCLAGWYRLRGLIKG